HGSGIVKRLVKSRTSQPNPVCSGPQTPTDLVSRRQQLRPSSRTAHHERPARAVELQIGSISLTPFPGTEFCGASPLLFFAAAQTRRGSLDLPSAPDPPIP